MLMLAPRGCLYIPRPVPNTCGFVWRHIAQYWYSLTNLCTVGSPRKIELSMNNFHEKLPFWVILFSINHSPKFHWLCSHSLRGRIAVNKCLCGALYKSAKSAAQIRLEICRCQKLHLCLRKYMYFQCWCASTLALIQPRSQAPVLWNANIEAV